MRDMPKEQWETFFDQLSVDLGPKGSELDASRLNCEGEIQAQWLTLRGVNYRCKEDVLQISLEGLDYMVSKPEEVAVDEADGMLSVVSVKDRSGTTHLIKLRDPLPLAASAAREKRDDLAKLDEAGRESFPASDPPAWTG